MPYERKNNTFSAFKNKRKEEKEHADLTGEAMIEGKMYWVNVWKKVDKNGDTWISGSIRPKDKTEKAKLIITKNPKDEPEELPW